MNLHKHTHVFFLLLTHKKNRSITNAIEPMCRSRFTFRYDYDFVFILHRVPFCVPCRLPCLICAFEVLRPRLFCLKPHDTILTPKLWLVMEMHKTKPIICISITCPYSAPPTPPKTTSTQTAFLVCLSFRFGRARALNTNKKPKKPQRHQTTANIGHRGSQQQRHNTASASPAGGIHYNQQRPSAAHCLEHRQPGRLKR